MKKDSSRALFLLGALLLAVSSASAARALTETATETATDPTAVLTDAATAAVEVTLSPVASLKEHFKQWMTAHRKSYDTPAEHDKRMGIFAANKEFVDKHNAEHAEVGGLHKLPNPVHP